MKIGVITFWYSKDNYGQLLQCFALQYYLKSLGHEVFLIRYLPTYKKLSFIRRVANGIKNRLTSTPAQRRERKKFHQVSLNNDKLNVKRDFEGFRNAHIESTDFIYHSIDELRANPPYADAYITGSDQVWRGPVPSEFLDFGPSHTKRIAYAPSIGRDYSRKERKLFAQYLSRFDAISVREQNACSMCHQVGFRDAIVTLDPTLLLKFSDYEKIKKNNDEFSHPIAPYVFFYVINIRTASEIYWDVFKKHISENGFEVKAVASSGYLPAQELLPGIHNELATIPEWLSFIQHSQYVVTTSFHGIVFCILYHKPFYAVLLNNEFAKANDRICTLLNMLGIEGRIVSSAEDIHTCTDNSIDWETVDKKLDKLREKSMDFIINALQ